MENTDITKNDNSENVLNKITNNIKDELKHRSKSKFIGSYVISWIIISWKSIFYILFSKDTPDEKLTSCYTTINTGSFLYPLIGVAVYMIAIPALESLFNGIVNLFLDPVETLKIEKDFKRRELLIKNEIRLVVKRNNLFEEMSNETELERLTKSNRFLNEKVVELEEIINSKDGLLDRLNSEIKVMNYSTKIDGKVKLGISDELLKFLHDHPKEAQFFFKNYREMNEIHISKFDLKTSKILINFGLIIKNSDGFYQLTNYGRDVRDTQLL